MSRIKKLKEEVLKLGRDPKDYCYDHCTRNAYRIEHTSLNTFNISYQLLN